MAKKFRSVLEKYDAKGNRNLPTPEEQAIEQDTTLEGLLIGPGRAAASAIKNAINKKAQTRKFDTPEIGSSLPPSGLDPWKNVGFNKKPKEILAEQEARSNKGAMIKAAERATEKGVRRSYGEFGEYVLNNKINAAKEKEQEGTSGGFTFSETPSDFKKGGKVSASSRGDGIAKRGKTRGKMY
jgi:hypothetical protein